MRERIYHRGLFVAALALLASCAQPPVTTTTKVAAQKPDTWTPQSPQPAWWLEAQPCPDGAELYGALPPKGRVLQCLSARGVKNGRESVWFENGHEGTLTEYKNGVRHGSYLYWLHGRKLIEGAFQEGRRHGSWTYWFDEASDFDTQGRMKPLQPVVVELYNKGLLLQIVRKPSGAPEESQDNMNARGE